MLFYKRRTSRPLGGPSHLKIEEARNKPKPATPVREVKVEDSQLPTPPYESSALTSYTGDLHSTSVRPYDTLPALYSPGDSPPSLEELPFGPSPSISVESIDDPYSDHHIIRPSPPSPTSSIGVEADPDDLDTTSSLEPFTQSHSSSQWGATPDLLDSGSYNNSPDPSVADLGKALKITDMDNEEETNSDLERGDEHNSDPAQLDKFATRAYTSLKQKLSEQDVDPAAHADALVD